MQVVVSSDERISCDDELIRRVEGVVEGAVGEFELLARVEVHLADLASQVAGERDKACRIEARAPGVVPFLATHEAPTLSEAIHEATDKLRRIIGRVLRSAARSGAPMLPQSQATPLGALGSTSMPALVPVVSTAAHALAPVNPAGAAPTHR